MQRNEARKTILIGGMPTISMVGRCESENYDFALTRGDGALGIITSSLVTSASASAYRRRKLFSRRLRDISRAMLLGIIEFSIIDFGATRYRGEGARRRRCEAYSYYFALLSTREQRDLDRYL